MVHRAISRAQLISAAALFSTGGAAVKATEMSAWQVAGFRSGIAAATILLLAPAARRGLSPRVVVVALAYAATMVLFVTSNKLTTAANAIFLQSSAPLYLLLIGPFLLREPIRRDDVWLIAVVAAGLALFFIGVDTPVATAPDPSRGNVLAMLSGLSWALTIAGLRWIGSGPDTGGDPALATVALGNLLALVGTLPLALPVTGASASDWAVVLYLGVVQIGVAYLLLTRGLRHVPALEASVLLLAEPALNPVWAWALHGEVPNAWSLAGGGLILSASVLRSWLGSRRPEPLAHSG